MTSSRLIYSIFSGFIAGILVLIYIQYNSAKSINNLVSGNEQLLNEIQVSRELKELEKDLLTAESKIRGTVASRDTSHILGLDAQISRIENGLVKLQQVTDDDSSILYVDKLDELVREKIRYNQEMLDAFFKPGRPSAASLFAANTGKSLTDSIITAINKVDSIRKIVLEKATRSADISGKKALRLSTILITLVLLTALGIFWYIIHIIRKQIRLINELNLSEKKIRETAAIKEKFMANMSHEIRTPMNAILGFTRLLELRELDPASKEYVETIRQSGENLLTIINDILDLSKIEAGMLRIEKVPFSIRDMVHSAGLLFRDKAREKGVALEASVEEGVPDKLEGDPVRLMQILVNLVSNAVKFTSTGYIRIHVKNEGGDPSLLLAGITVSDTGIGISPDKKDKIFDRFLQADDTVNRRYGGTGLGLSIVKELVLAQNGQIDVQSTPGEGTRFHLSIPYRILPETGNTVLKIQAAAVQNRSDTVPVHILVAEDNEINQRLLKHLLERWEYRFTIVSNGKELLNLLQSQSFDLVLMDIQMPELDGYAATRVIREELKLELPVIAMTAHAMTGEKEKCLKQGMNDYISKPLREEELYRILQHYSSPRNRMDATPPGTSPVYCHIDLHYLKELSGGSISFEKTVTGQFLESLPGETAAMERSLQEKDFATLRKQVHNLRTSISVMGLLEPLRPVLDSIEYENLSPAETEQQLSALITCCRLALQEASQYYNQL